MEIRPKTLDKIPGLNFNNKRVQIIASFEEAMRHAFRIYSSRLFDEITLHLIVAAKRIRAVEIKIETKEATLITKI